MVLDKELDKWVGKNVRVYTTTFVVRGKLKSISETGVVLEYFTDAENNPFLELEVPELFKEGDMIYETERWIPQSQIISIETDITEGQYQRE